MPCYAVRVHMLLPLRRMSLMDSQKKEFLPGLTVLPCARCSSGSYKTGQLDEGGTLLVTCGKFSTTCYNRL